MKDKLIYLLTDGSHKELGTVSNHCPSNIICKDPQLKTPLCRLHDDHYHLTKLKDAGYNLRFYQKNIYNIEWLKYLMHANETSKKTIWNYIIDLGFRTFPELDYINNDELLKVTEELLNTQGFKNLKWRFSNGWDLYGHKEKKRSQWFIKQIKHIDPKNIIMDLTNFDVVDYYKKLLPEATINYHTCFGTRWLSENLHSDVYINNNTNKTKHFLCLNRLHKPHRTQVHNYIIENKLMDKFHFSYTSENVFLTELEEKKISQHGYWTPLPVQDTPPHDIVNDCYAYLNTETFFYKYEIESPEIWWGDNGGKVVEPSDDWLSDTMFDHSFITEKTFKSAYCELPMLVVGLPNILQTWKRLGFESFPEFFDESYDREYDCNKRMQLVQYEIEKFCNTDIEDIRRLYYTDAVQKKLKHNKKNFYRMIKNNQSWKWMDFDYQPGLNSVVDEVLNS